MQELFRREIHFLIQMQISMW